MTEEEVLEAIRNGENAYSLLYDANKNYATRFKRSTQALEKLLKDVRKDFPDACFYAGDGTLHLMLGSDHTFDGSPQNELVAESSNTSIFNGGDW